MDRKAGYMRNDVLFINTIIVITLLYSLIQWGQLIFMGGRVEKADAEIIKTRYANKNGTHFRNSQWAVVKYKAEGRNIVSDNMIQVSMYAKEGDTVMVKYYKNNPQRLAVFSAKRCVTAFIITDVFIIIRVIMQ
jgi:predicted SnoaL-like aldol condensation-catalyzing enzyme